MILYTIDFIEKALVSKEVFADEALPICEQFSLFSSLIEKELVTVYAHTNNADIVLPDVCKENVVVALKWSKRFNVPDFGYDQTSVFGTLSFGKKQYWVLIPWSAVFRIDGADSKISKTWAQ